MRTVETDDELKRSREQPVFDPAQKTVALAQTTVNDVTCDLK
jgi:hypothetical protein